MKKMKTKDLVLIALFAALTAIGAQLSIPIGPVPITLQSLFCLLSALILGAKGGALSQILYVIMGFIGLPVFSNGQAGLTFALRPTFGFIIGFIACAYVVGTISTKLNKTVLNYFLSSLAGTIIIYLFGIIFFYFNMKYLVHKDLNFYTILKLTTIPFLPGDLLKCIVASLVAVPVSLRAKKEGYI